MINRFLLIVILLTGFYTDGFAQTILTGRDKSSTRIFLKGDFSKVEYNFTETDSTCTLTTNDAKISKVKVHCSFNGAGKCQSEKISFDCDSCYQHIFKAMLGKTRFKWKEVAQGRYLSKESRKLLLAGNSTAHYFTLSMVNVSDEEYKKLLAN